LSLGSSSRDTRDELLKELHGHAVTAANIIMLSGRP
jgi:hypothetical protein